MLCGAALLAGCADDPYADWGDAPRPTFFTVVVRPHDTLSSIAARYDVPVSTIVQLNGVSDASRIYTGESLRIPATSQETRVAVLSEATDAAAPNYAPPPKPIEVRKLPPVTTATTATAAPPVAPRLSQTVAQAQVPGVSRPGDAPKFVWPVSGPVILPFGNTGGGERNDGINIAASEGTPIHAAASGTVTYVGNELRGYGNLVLIQHDDGYVTAYAHAESVSVHRGDHVDKGQVIGLAGATGEVDRPQLHFEIRKDMQPVNPKQLLAAK
jgi:murein DD-endopeptidase MepM/ murein hydrolase activator NlpD